MPKLPVSGSFTNLLWSVLLRTSSGKGSSVSSASLLPLIHGVSSASLSVGGANFFSTVYTRQMSQGVTIRQVLRGGSSLVALHRAGMFANFSATGLQNVSRLLAQGSLEKAWPYLLGSGLSKDSFAGLCILGMLSGAIGDTAGQHLFYVQKVLQQTGMKEGRTAILDHFLASPTRALALYSRGLPWNAFRNGWGYMMAYAGANTVLKKYFPEQQHNPALRLAVTVGAAYVGLFATVPLERQAVRAITRTSKPLAGVGLVAGALCLFRGFWMKGISIGVNNTAVALVAGSRPTT